MKRYNNNKKALIRMRLHRQARILLTSLGVCCVAATGVALCTINSAKVPEPKSIPTMVAEAPSTEPMVTTTTTTNTTTTQTTTMTTTMTTTTTTTTTTQTTTTTTTTATIITEPIIIEEPVIIEEPTSSSDRTYLGSMRITGYVGTGNPTASGEMPYVGGVALSTAYNIPYGSRIYIDGLGEYVVNDTGCAYGVVDVFCNSVDECYALTSYADVYLLN